MQSFYFICGLLLVAYAEGVIISQCDQIRALRDNGVPDDQLVDWLCLIDHESHGDTQAQNRNNVDGSWDWGIFQINDAYWCGREGVAGDCNIPCSTLFDDNITDDIQCAKLIYSRMGFPAWTAWRNYCQGDKPPLPSC